MGREGVNNREE